MPRHYSLQTTSLFLRDVKKCTKKEPRTREIIERAQNILESDPYNTAKEHDIKKLEGLKNGEGIFRLRIRDYRIRYDVLNSDIVLHSFRNRIDAYR